MSDNLDTEKKSHSYLWQTKKLKYTLTNFCSSLGENKTNKQIDAAFSVWQIVCGLSFQKVSSSEDCEIKISFLTDHDDLNTANKINCPFKLNGQKGGRWLMRSIQEQMKYVGIFILTLKVLQSKKQNRVMGNIIYFL